MSEEQESTLTTSTVEQPGSPGAHSEDQSAHSRATSEEQPQPSGLNNGAEEPRPSEASSVDQQGPLGATSVEWPGPSGLIV